jgi:hypothetical protein
MCELNTMLAAGNGLAMARMKAGFFYADNTDSI